MQFGGVGAVVGGLLGGATSFAGQRKAMGEWRENQVTANLKENALEKAQNEDAYAMRQGEESRGLLKGLYKKQLGIQS